MPIVNPPWRDAQRLCRACFEVSPPLAYVGAEGQARPLFHEEGNLSARVLFVVKAPNWEDTFDPKKGRMTIEPGTDPSGALSWDLLTHEAGLAVEDVLFVNTVLCLPADRTSVKRAQLDLCLRHLRTTIDNVQPDIVVALGREALLATDRLEAHGFAKVTDVVGQPIPWMGRSCSR